MDVDHYSTRTQPHYLKKWTYMSCIGSSVKAYNKKGWLRSPFIIEKMAFLLQIEWFKFYNFRENDWIINSNFCYFHGQHQGYIEDINLYLEYVS